MKIKFNKFERIAGLFVLAAIGGSLFAGVVVAIKKGWFESKIEYKTQFETASGLSPGTQVQMAGLRVGSVESVELVSDSKVIVTFNIPARHAEKVRKDSIAQTTRPFLIGDKILEVTVGSAASPKLEAGAFVTSVPSTDLMDIVGGRQLGAYMEEMGAAMTSLRTVLHAFADAKRAETIVASFDEVLPLLRNVNSMAQEMTSLGKQATRNKNLQKIVENLVVATDTMNKIMPELNEALESNPSIGKDMVGIVESLSKLTMEMSKVLPALTELAPELPHASRRAIEAMDEAVIVLKAMQKSFLLRGSVEDVRKEEADAAKQKADKEKQRSTASESSSK